MTTVEVQLESELVEGEEPEALNGNVRKGYIIFEYLNEKITLGRLAELVGMKVENAMTWLNRFGISTSRFDRELEEGHRKPNRERFLKQRESEVKAHLSTV